MAIEQLRPEILAIEAQLVGVYRRAQVMIDTQLAQLVDDPERFSVVARLRDLRERITTLLQQVDIQAATWVNGAIPTLYRFGVADAAARSLTQLPSAAVSRLQLGTLRPLLDATSNVDASVKRLITKIADDAALDKLLGLRDLRGASDRMTELVEQQGVSAVSYSNGSQVPIEHYAAMVIRTRTGVAYNSGTLDATKGGGTEFVEISDGPGCGLDGHDELPEADGLIMTIDEAYDHILSHPNCRRAFSPRPDITSIDDKGVPTLTGALSAA